jgi:hypothetical protein
MKIALWILQSLLALAFLMAGGTKVMTPGPELAAMGMTMPIVALKIAGVSEVLGALGLILPSALRIQPWLTPLAAALLALVMALAIPGHLLAGDPVSAIGAPVVLGTLSLFVAWGRWRHAPIAPRAARASAATA